MKFNFNQTPKHHEEATIQGLLSYPHTMFPHLEGTHILTKERQLTNIIITSLLIWLLHSRTKCIETPISRSIILSNTRSNLLTLSSSGSNHRTISHFVPVFTTTKATPGIQYTLTIMFITTICTSRLAILGTTSFLNLELSTPRFS